MSQSALLCGAWLIFLNATAQSQNSATASIPDPHHHVVSVDTLDDIGSDVRMLVLPSLPAEARDSVVSPNGQWVAFVFSTADEWARVGFQDRQTGKRYELAGLPLPYRPVDDLVWIDSTLVAFDRWSQPHYGVHYVVDVQNRQLVRAAPFPDAFLLRQRHDKSR